MCLHEKLFPFVICNLLVIFQHQHPLVSHFQICTKYGCFLCMQQPLKVLQIKFNKNFSYLKVYFQINEFQRNFTFYLDLALYFCKYQNNGWLKDICNDHMKIMIKFCYITTVQQLSINWNKIAKYKMINACF